MLASGPMLGILTVPYTVTTVTITVNYGSLTIKLAQDPFTVHFTGITTVYGWHMTVKID
jgi:hypothetical protein